MSSARRKTSSNNGIAFRSHNYLEVGKNKPRISLQRRFQSSFTALPFEGSLALPAAYHRRKLLSRIVLATVIIYLLIRTFQGLRAPSTNHPKKPATTIGSFPNITSITPQGRTALRALSLGGQPVSSSQVTFVIPIPRQKARGVILLISQLQLLKCQIHILVPPDQIVELEYLLDLLLSTTSHVYIYPSDIEDTGAALSMLHHAKHVETPWMWIMADAHWSESQDAMTWMNNMAQSIPSVRVPVGMYGARLTESGIVCIPSTNQPEPVAFLIPPFLAPTSLLVESESGIMADTQANVWASLGERIGRIGHLGMGGVVSTVAHSSPEWCKTSHMVGVGDILKVSGYMLDSLRDRFHSSTAEVVQFAFLLPDQTSLQRVAPTACRMLQNGHNVYITVRGSSDVNIAESSNQQYLNLGCHLHYVVGSGTPDGYSKEILALVDDWCAPSSMENKILIVNDLDDNLGYDRISKKRLCATAVLYLSNDDLENSEWLAMLRVNEWRAWDQPIIELAVITHDRPWSLKRLLDSVKQAQYFGDAVNVVINLEQTADLETRHIAESFTMGFNKGNVAVRHRIVYAGLMTAVVESWHPHGNHSYGVMLEDDVELSPMFYAWVKFCVLRYRYGVPTEVSSQLYGISLYQPKVTELHMKGRLSFDAKDIFAKLNIEYPHTPYLSQVPCSWGAVYFPEHWREFQQYLTLRLSEYVMPVTDIVVPDLRSNKWSRSWKKFFNEMVYLQGYVSLYPNYDHFVSLSTNHLEVGEHVPANIGQEKQKQFFLPLMQDTRTARLHPGTELGVNLLDLPLSTLPEWSDLPVLDLWGDVSTLEKLRSVGLARRANMSVCHPDETQAAALKYLCHFNEAALSVEESRKLALSTLTEDDGPDLMQG